MHTNYQHYSFDLWLTLIRSNPAFKQIRAKYFHTHFNYANKPLELIVSIFRQVDLMCNSINEKTGKNIDADEMYLMVLNLINDGDEKVWQIDVTQLYRDIESLLFDNLPIVYCTETVGILQYIKQNTNSTISILSNTGFIKGVTLRRVLNQIGMDKYIDFQLYSDEAGMSKPNPEFFKLMLDELKIRYTNINLNGIIHIGDNPVADLAGAKRVGIDAQLINSNNIYLPVIFNNALNLLTT